MTALQTDASFPVSTPVHETISPVVPLPIKELVPPERDRVDVTALGKSIFDAINSTLADRKSLEVDWIKIKWILQGHHYFHVEPLTGRLVPAYPDNEDDVRAYTNMMLNRYKRELGRRNSINVNIIAAPRNFSAPQAFHHARRATMGLEEWQRESKFFDKIDLFNQIVLRVGLAGFLPMPSWDGSTAHIEICSGIDLFPYPSTATNAGNAAGIIYRQFLSEAFLEQSVKEGTLHPDVLTQISDTTIADEPGNPFLSANHDRSTAKIKGVSGYYFWIFPGREWPLGLHGMSIKDRIYAVHVTDEQVGGFPVGGPPILVGDTKIDSVWYPQSFCAPLIGLNLEDDRQLSNDIAIAEVNRHGGWTLVPENTISRNDVQTQFGGFVTYKTTQFGMDQRNPFFNITPPRPGGEGVRVAGRLSAEADESASQIPVSGGGGAFPRADSDAALERLFAQSDMPNETFFRRTANAMVELHERVMDILSTTWGPEKWLSIVGPHDAPQEAIIRGGEVPTNQLVRLSIAPLVPGSRVQTLGMLNGLLASQSITKDEYKHALVVNGFQPKGVTLKNRDDEFAIQKTLYIYSDGETPRKWEEVSDEDFDLEPHLTVIRIMRGFMNSIEFKLSASKQVRAELRAEILRHTVKAGNELTRLRAQSQVADDERNRFENRLGAEEDSLEPGNPLAFPTELLGAIR